MRDQWMAKTTAKRSFSDVHKFFMDVQWPWPKSIGFPFILGVSLEQSSPDSILTGIRVNWKGKPGTEKCKYWWWKYRISGLTERLIFFVPEQFKIRFHSLAHQPIRRSCDVSLPPDISAMQVAETKEDAELGNGRYVLYSLQTLDAGFINSKLIGSYDMARVLYSLSEEVALL